MVPCRNDVDEKLLMSSSSTAPQEDDDDVATFACSLNRGKHWHSYLCNGICSGSSSSILQMLVVASHFYAIVVVGPSIVAAAAASTPGSGRTLPPISHRQTWLFSTEAAASATMDIINTPFQEMMRRTIHNEKEKKIEQQGNEKEEKKRSEDKNILISLLSSDPATMLFDAAQILMQDRTPPAPDDAATEGHNEKDTCAARTKRELFLQRVEYFQDARLILLPQTVGLVMLPVLMIPSLVAPADAMVPGMGTNRQEKVPPKYSRSD